MMSELKEVYDERRLEVSSYLEILQVIDGAAKNGRVAISGTKFVLESKQIKMMYSTLFLHLYGLIECILSSFLREIEKFLRSGKATPSNLPPELFKLWVSNAFRGDKDLTLEKKIDIASQIFWSGYKKEPITKDFKFYSSLYKKNVDLNEIKAFLEKFSISLDLSKECNSAINRRVLNDENVLTTIKSLRNKLAHGEQSFFEASSGFDFATLSAWSATTLKFTDELVDLLDNYLDKNTLS